MANTLITLKNASLAFGDYPLLDNTDFSVQEGERIGLIGRNGTGKSSMLQVLARKSALDDGEIQVKDGLRVVLLEQEPVFPPAPTIRESLIAQSGFDPSDDKLYWKQIAKLDAYLQRLNVRADADPGTASGGERKKAAIALVLAQEPDLLLLDEPTNHLDITTIALLEDLIRETFKNTRALVVITHDREFLDAVSTRIVELDRGILRSYPGNFADYEHHKNYELAIEETARRKFDKFWAQEEVWIRKGIEARRTRNEGRVRRLERLRREREARRDRMGQVNMSIDAGEKSGKLVAELKNVSKSFGDKTVIRNLNFTLMRGDRLGLIGPNGAGKTTTLRMLTGYLPPTSGTATIAGFDIVKNPLEARKHLGYLPEHVPLYDDQRVTEYLKFRARLKGISSKQIWPAVSKVVEQCGLDPVRRKMIRTLSKGYRQRVGLADALLGEPDLLILDEPTNGLDPNQIRQIRELIKGLAANHTIILSTHILSEVEMICNKVIIIDQGTIKAADTPSNLTANLRAAGKITLEFRGDLELITQKLESLEHVKKVIHEGTDADGWHTLTVRAEAGTDTREKAARLLAEQGCPLRHIYRHTPTLEEVFVEMTRKD